MSIAYEKELKTEACLPAAQAADWWDCTGLATSLACIVHCLATPLAMILLPAMGTWLASPLVHQFLAIGVIAAAAGSLAPGYLQHRRLTVLVPAMLGMGIVLFAAFCVECCAWEAATLPAGSQMSIVGGIFLIAAHLENLRVSRRCACR